MLKTVEAYETVLESLGFEWLRDDLWTSEDERTVFSWEDREGGYWSLSGTDGERLDGEHIDYETFRAIVSGFLAR